MKRFLLALLLVGGVALGDTSSNLITSPLTPTVPASSPGGYSGGGSAGYNSSTNTYYFGYTSQQIGQTWAINQALSGVGAGIQINGFTYGFSFLNGGDSYGSLVSHAYMTDAAGNINLQEAISWTQSPNWQTVDRTVTYNTAQELANIGQGGLYFTGQDSRFWAGYYGPQVKDPYFKVNYTVDQCAVNPQSNPSCPGYKTYYNMWDDGYAQVNLPFAFPFYGQVFTTSFMYTNGVVGFLNNNWGFCCDGTDLNNQAFQSNSPWNYAIYALNTDLVPGSNSEFYTQVTDNGTGLKYSWVNVPEIGTNLNNTFSVQIKNTGYIGINYQQVNLSPWRNPLIGIAGDISQGQYSVTYFGQASGLPALAGTTNVYTGTETTDICTINPLYNSSCPGYEQAYFNQQCSINALYNASCPGYAAAYLTYQCSINPLYSTTCYGYEQAYFNQQCSISALYNSACPGYEAAYFAQQCELDGLYSNSCPNYAEAYALKYVVNTSSSSRSSTTSVVSTTEPSVQVSSDGSVTTAVSATGDSTVDSVIKSETTSTTSTTAPVQLAPSSNNTSQPAQVAKQEAKKDDNTQNSTKKESTEQASSSSSSNSKSTKAEARKEAVAKAGKQAQQDMDSAQSMQAQVAVQGVVISAMGFTPGFDAYSFIMPDGKGYKPFQIYKNQSTVDNNRMLRGLSGASDRLHSELVDLQYNR